MARNPSAKTYERRWHQQSRDIKEAAAHSPERLASRVFIGKFPCGLSYADRENEESGDYKRLAFLPYDTLKLEVYGKPHRLLRAWIEADAATYQARIGERESVSACDQYVVLGSKAVAP